MLLDILSCPLFYTGIKFANNIQHFCLYDSIRSAVTNKGNTRNESKDYATQAGRYNILNYTSLGCKVSPRHVLKFLKIYYPVPQKCWGGIAGEMHIEQCSWVGFSKFDLAFSS
jgi:hypothetical protein